MTAPSHTDPSDATPATPAPPGARLRARVFPAALVAAVASWLVGETPLVRVPPRSYTMTVMGRTFDSSTPQSRRAAEDASGVRFYGLFGATLGLGFGLAGGLTRRSTRAAAAAAALGAIAGAVFGLAAARGVIPLFHLRQASIADDLIGSLAMHAGVFAAAGVAGGLALGVGLGGGRRSLVRSVLGGLVGAAVGATVVEFLGAVLFAAPETGDPLAATATLRLLGPLLVSAFAALGASGAVAE